SSGVGSGAAEPQDGIAVGNPVLGRWAIVEQHVRQARARPRRWAILAEEMLRSARNVADDRRVDITIAEFGPDHFVALGLLHLGNAHQVVARLPAGRSVVADVSAILRAPFPAAERGIA